MDSQSLSTSFSVELKLIRARNIYVNTSREVFIRCYLSTGSNKRVRIDSQEIPSNSNNLIWNQTFSLNCSGTPETLNSLKQGTIVFELRCRRSTSCLASIRGSSKLLARAEMPWNDVMGVHGMEVEKWIVMSAKDKRVYTDDVKPPAIEIAVKVEEKKESARELYNCGCMDCGCNYCIDYEFFALGAALEAF